MKAHPLAVILLSIILVIWLTQMAKNYLKYLEDKERKKNDTLNNLENTRFFVKAEKEENKNSHNFKEVLQKNNCDSSTKPTSHPHDFNPNQNLNNKFAKNVYRDKSGRFKSKKEWKEAQGTY